MRTNLNVPDQERRHLLACALIAARKTTVRSIEPVGGNVIKFTFTSDRGSRYWKASFNVETGKFLCFVGNLNGANIYKHMPANY